MTPLHLNPIRQAAIALCLASALCAAQAQTTAPAPGTPVTLNFVNAEIEAVARTMAVITGRNVVVDPRVKGTLNLSSESPISPAAAWDQFMAGLRLQSYAVVQSAGIYKVVPEAEAKIQTTVVNAGPASQVRGNQIVTQIFPLNHENANTLVPVLRPLITPNNTINVSPGSNSLVITDYADNLQRIARIVSALDVSNASDIDIIPLRYAVASDLGALVNRLLEGGSGSGGAQGGVQNAAAQAGGDSYRTAVLADPRSNSLIIRTANPARASLVRALVARLDRASLQEDTGNIHVVYLRNADAAQLAVTLRAAMASDPGFANATNGASAASGAGTTNTANSGLSGIGNNTNTSSSSTSGSGLNNSNGTSSNLLASAQQPSTGGQIQADPANNALIISAPAPVYRQMRAVIDQLDIRRAQVYMEALIAEVSADNTGDLGVQWLGLAGSGNGYIGGGTNFGSSGNILNIAGGIALGTTEGYTAAAGALNRGLNIGLYRGSLAVLANALETKTNANILSTPTLLTLDNQEAKITIGQNVPVATGSYSNASNGSTVNPFTTYDRMDVGLTLNVRPQINSDGTVKLQIYQEVSSISGSLGSAVTDSSNIVTNKRTLASTVLVQDGTTAVLGGLIQDQLNVSNDEVPVLSKIPFLGALFRNQSRSRSKTNLMVFLRPVILRDNQSMDRLALDRYDMMRTLQIQGQPEASVVLPINSGPVLPAEPNNTPISPNSAVPQPMVTPITPPVSQSYQQQQQQQQAQPQAQQPATPTQPAQASQPATAPGTRPASWDDLPDFMREMP